MLLVGEGIQMSTERFNRQLRRWMPPVVSWPLAVAGMSALGAVLTDKVVIRQILNTAYRKADALDREFLPGAAKPREKERSGSPASLELSLIHISEPTRREWLSRMPSSA